MYCFFTALEKNSRERYTCVQGVGQVRPARFPFTFLRSHVREHRVTDRFDDTAAMNDGSAVTRNSNVPTTQRVYVKVVVQVLRCAFDDFCLVFNDTTLVDERPAIRYSNRRDTPFRSSFYHVLRMAECLRSVQDRESFASRFWRIRAEEPFERKKRKR